MDEFPILYPHIDLNVCEKAESLLHTLTEENASLNEDMRKAKGGAHIKALIRVIDYVGNSANNTMLTNRLGSKEIPIQYDGVTFATIQSAILKKDILPYFDMIIVDEAHRVGSVSYRNVISSLEPEFLCGVTATPWRGDNFNIRSILGDPVSNVGIAEGLRLGYLSEVDYRMLADNLNWNLVQDLSQFNYRCTL